MSQTMQTPPTSQRAILIKEVSLRLGLGMVDVELDSEHYNLALTVAIQRYAQRSNNAIEESFLFMDIQPDQMVYTLPNEVQTVLTILRRSIGGTAGGAAVDPFSLAFVNNIYMIQNPGGLGTTGAGMLATYDSAMQFQNVAGRLFGRDVLFVFDASSKRLTIERRFSAVEQVVLHVYNNRPEEYLLIDPFARPWLRDYTVAYSKLMLGEARSKYGNIAGPQGGITLNGEALKTEAQAEMDRLDKELTDFYDSKYGSPFIIG